MWRWLKTWFSKRDELPEAWRPAERAVYEYFNGKKMVRDDPLEIYRRLMNVWPILQSNLNAASTVSKFADRAWDEALSQLRGVFRVQPVVDGGLTSSELQDLADHFVVWCDRVKKNLRPLRTSFPPVPASTPVSSGDVGSATSSSADSGSTAAEPSTGIPPPSPGESPSPSVESIPETISGA